MEYWVIFNLAFFASFSHCFGMCGGIVMGLNSKIAKSQSNILLSNLLYNVGRLSSYLMIGALCGGVGMVFEINPLIKSWVLIGIGILTSFFALCMLFAPKILAWLEPSFEKNGYFSSLFKALFQSLSYKSFYFLGVLNGFLPCGIVYYFALIALSSNGVLQGMLVMATFGITTFLPLLLFGLFSALLLSIRRYQNEIYKFCAVFMFLFGLYTLYKGIKGL